MADPIPTTDNQQAQAVNQPGQANSRATSGRETMAQRLAAALSAAGSDTAFGVPGGGPNLDLIGAMDAVGIRFVLAHGETSACIMASVHGYLTGRPAAAVVTRGPGAASAANGAAQATLDRHPLILITDSVPSANRLRVPHQRLDQQAMFDPLCKATASFDATTEEAELAALIEHAVQAPAGAVHLDYDSSATPIPVSATTTAITTPPENAGIDAHLGLDSDTDTDLDTDTDTDTDLDNQRPGQEADPTAVDRLVAAVAEAERPVVIVGLGALTGPPIGHHLLDIGAPVLTTYQAIGAVPSESPVSAGLFTNGAAERGLLDRADLILTVGLDPVEPIPAPWDYNAPVVSIAPVATSDPYLPISIEAVGPVEPLLARLTAIDHHWQADDGARHREAVRAELAAGTDPGSDPEPQPESASGANTAAVTQAALSPLEVVTVTVDNRPPSLLTTVDAGAHFLAIMPFWPVEQPKDLLISNGLATMGYALPAAIGAALANSGRPILCLVGDGGLAMTLAELETMARLRLPVTVVVFNDSGLSLIKIKQRAAHGGDEVVDYRPTDFATIATASGMTATAVSDGPGLAAALNGDWTTPRLIDVAVDPRQYGHLINVTRG